jgi:capsular polysaccharide transport system ATP-binding protein
MIEFDQVSKAYATPHGMNVILDCVDIEFPTRVSVGVLGRNGAGKSTLLRLIAGIEQPDSGRIQRTGTVSWPISFGGGFSGALTGEENCRLIARIHGAPVDEVVGFALDFAELGSYFQMPVRTYSSGMRARLAFGLSMALDFDVYLVDEVTAVGDATFRKKCLSAFTERRDRSSVIIVSHQMRTIEEYCSHCAVLKDGRLHYFDSVDAAAREFPA